MNGITFYRILKNGLMNYWRNFLLSLAATLVMVIALFILSSIIILSALANISLSTIKEKVDISIYFKQTASEQTIRQIEVQVRELAEVKSIEYIPPVTARDKFKELHKDEPLLLESVDQFSDEDNPFPASFAIRVKSLDDYGTIINLFRDEKFTPFVKKITDKRDLVDRLNRIINVVRKLGLALILIFAAVTVIVMFNTIRLTIYNRREEIEIMRLVGASNWFIRGPFIVEGILYGLAGALVTAALVFPILFILTPKISSFLELDITQFNYLALNYLALLGILLAIGSLLGIVSSATVVRKYLKI